MIMIVSGLLYVMENYSCNEVSYVKTFIALDEIQRLLDGPEIPFKQRLKLISLITSGKVITYTPMKDKLYYLVLFNEDKRLIVEKITDTDLIERLQQSW